MGLQARKLRMVSQDFSGAGTGVRRSRSRVLGRSLLGASLLVAVGALVLLCQLLAPGGGDGVLTSRGVGGGPVELDVDDDTFFHTGSRIGKVGDRELQLANAALKKGDLERAGRYAEHAAQAYKKADASGRLKQAMEVVGSVDSALKSAARVKSMQLQAVVARARHVQRVKAAMEQEELKKETAAAASDKQEEEEEGKEKVAASAAATSSQAKDVESRAPATSAAATASAATSKKTSSVLSEAATPSPSSDPKVLDCGPLGSNCHDGEFYAKQKEEKEEQKQQGHGEGGALTANQAVAKAEARLAKKLARVQGISACEKCLHSWTSESLSCVVDKCPSAPHDAGGKAKQVLHAVKQSDDEALRTAMEGLDWKQVKLNNARSELFARFVGRPGASNTNKVMLVSKFAAEWVPGGSTSVRSWLHLTPAVSDSLAELGIKPGMKGSVKITTTSGIPETVESADECVDGGLSLEEAMAPLNEEQARLNDERQQIVRSLTQKSGGKSTKMAEVKVKTPLVPVLVAWPDHLKPDSSSIDKSAKTQDLAMTSGNTQAAPVAPVAPAAASAASSAPVIVAAASARAPRQAVATQPAPSSPSAETRAPLKVAQAVAVKEAPTTQPAASRANPADDSEGGKLPAAGQQGNELPIVKASAARNELSSFFDNLIDHRVAVGRGRRVGGGLAAARQESKAQMRRAEDAELGGKPIAKAAHVSHASEPFIGNELVHGQTSTAASSDISSYFNSLIKKGVFVGDGTAKGAKSPVTVSELHKTAPKPLAHAAAGAESSSAHKAPVIGNELKRVSDASASGDLESYFDGLVKQKVAVGDSVELKTAAKKGSKAPFVGNELKKLDGLSAQESLRTYFNKIIHPKKGLKE